MRGTTFKSDMLVLPLGSCDIVLGVQWLVNIGDMKMNFSKLIMEFMFEGRNHLLKGETIELKTVDARSLDKMVKCDAQIYMVRVVPQ